MSADLLARLIEAGTPAALVAEVAMALGRAEGEAAALERRRAADRDRQKRKRDEERHASHVTSRDVTDVTDETPSLDKSPQTPKINPNPAHTTRPRKGTRLAEDFELPDDWRAWAKAEKRWSDTEIDEEAAIFVDFWHAKAGKDAIKLDWPGTWRNWVRRSSRRSPQSGVGWSRAPQPAVPL